MEEKNQNFFLDKNPSQRSSIVNFRKTMNQDKQNNNFTEKGRSIDNDIVDNSPKNIFDTIIEYGLYALFFLMPIFISPFSFDAYEFNKTFLLLSASGILFFLWTVNSFFVKKRVVIAKLSTTIPFLAFLLFIIVSGFFGVDKVVSFFGFYGNFSDSIIFVSCLFLVYFVSTNFMSEKGSRSIFSGIITSTLLSALIVTLTSTLYYLGIKFLPYLSDVSSGFNLISSDLRVFSIYLVVVFFIALYDLFSENRLGGASKIIDIAVLLLSFILMLLIGWGFVWGAIFISTLVSFLLELVLSRDKANVSRSGRIAMLGVLAVSLIFLLSGLNFSNLAKGQIDIGNSFVSESLRGAMKLEALPDFNGEVVKGVAMKSISDNPVFGSGFGTYYYSFSKYKSDEFNYDENWSLRFSKGYNEFWEKISTIGLAGVLVFAILLLSMLYISARTISYDDRNKFLFSSLFAIIAFQLVYSDTAAIKFMFVVILVLVAGKNFLSRGNDKLVYDLENSKLKPILLFSSALFILVSVSLTLYSMQSYRAEAAYKKLSETDNVEDMDAEDIESIVEINPLRSEYESGISKIYIVRFNKFITLNSGDEESLENIRSASEMAISHAKKAVEISPNNASLWENYAYIYERVYEAGMAGADEWSIKGFETAIELDPSNPVLRTELGKVYMMQYEQLTSVDEKKSKIAEAKIEFEKALSLKNDYPDVMAELAYIYMQEENSEEAIVYLDKAVLQKDISIQTAVRIARTYYNLDEKEKAAKVLVAINNVNPNISDAHYILGIIYEEQENFTNAISEFNIVLELNPNNEIIKNKIEELSGE